MKPASAVVLLAIVAAFSGLGDEPSYRRVALRPGASATIRLDADLVLVPVTVTDRRGKLVPNLAQADFTLLEEKYPQELVSFSRENDTISLGMVVDLSGSMANKIHKTMAAVNEFLKSLEPGDEEFLVTFAETPVLRLPFTSQPALIREALSVAAPSGRTALYDAVELAIRQMRQGQHERKVLFLVSDGGDNHSRFTERELRRLVEEEDVQIHAVGIHDGSSNAMEERRGPWILEDLAKMTGGQHHMVNDISELPEWAARISRSLHDRYLLGYRPTPPGNSGTFRRIEVKVVQRRGASRYSVYARRGYRIP
jgi:Ca-activated chloride channel family protein